MAELSTIDQLRQRIASFVAPSSIQIAPEEPQVQSMSNSVSATVAEMAKVFEIERNRLNRLVDYEDMDDGDVGAIMDAAIDACLIADDGEMTGFNVQIHKGVTSGIKYQNIINQMLTDTQLQLKIRQYGRNTLKRGDTFLEIVPDVEMNIRRLKSVPPSVMRVNVDEHGDLDAGTEEVIRIDNGQRVVVPRAYQQVDDMDNVIAAWFPWEMLHIKWSDSDELIYSDGSLLESIRRPWKRQSAIEDAMAVARIDRAYMRELHHIDIHNKVQEDAEQSIRDYKRALTQEQTSDERSAQWPRKTRTNIFLGRRHRPLDGRLYEDLNRVDIIDPRNTGLEHIKDVEYLQRKMFSRVPAEVVGAGGVVGNDLTQQDVAASKMYQYIQTFVMTHMMIIPLCIMSVRMKGFMPQPEDFEVKWPSVLIRGSWRFSDARFRESMANVNYMEWGVTSREHVAKDVYRFNDQEWEEEVARIQGEKDAMPQPGGQSDTQSRRQGNQSA